MLIALLLCLASGTAPDSDRDGLSDFEEIHKYFTDPKQADSDGDGIPDGDWNERREFTYSVRAILDVLPPVDVASLCDDYQDGRVLETRDDAIQIEVVCYPFNTNAEAITEDREWRAHAADMSRWTAAGPTANWDAELQRQLRSDLSQAGIDSEHVSDKVLAEQVSKWLFQRSREGDGFTTFAADFSAGRPRVHDGMRIRVADELKSSGRTLEQQWERELFGKSMYVNAVHGSCTSSAIYLGTCLKALGLPTRSILCIPVIDASDARELALASLRLTHPQVRNAVKRAAWAAGSAWSSHTFNEVFVGGRWRRLNYSTLGQNTLDPNYLGLMVHVNTFSDFADAGLVAWGLRSVRDKQDVFGGSNPYSCAALSDQFGAHSKIERPPPTVTVLTVTKMYWLEDPAKPAVVEMKNAAAGGHLLLRVQKLESHDGKESYGDAYAAIGKTFVLRAAGHPDVEAYASRGFWIHPKDEVRDFYVHVDPPQFARMTRGVPYALVPTAVQTGARWEVPPGVTVTKP